MARANKDTKENKIYRLSLMKDDSHKKIWGIRFTYRGMIITGAVTVLVACAVIFSLVAFTPIRTLIPGYPDSHSKKLAIENAVKIDSLQSLITRWELYSENLRRVVDGETPISLDSIIKVSAERVAAQKDAAEISANESLLRRTVDEAEQFDLSEGGRNLPLEGQNLFPPLKGVISQGYDPVFHPYLDITAPAGSLVMSALDGTVIFSGWNDETGYTIEVQHNGNIVTIYKHCQKLLKKTGDKVSAGTTIALVGNTGSLTTGDHLHFELWHDGTPLNPIDYINF